MKAIIPAAGMGKRLRPHTNTYPKVMLNVAGKPILAHIVEDLIRAGFAEISIIVGYRKEVITDYFEGQYDVKFKFPEQVEMLGLGHAVSYGLDRSDEPALVLLGDTIFQTDLMRFREMQQNTLAVTEVEDPKRFGIVETAQDMTIVNMVEKPENPKGNLAIAGLYYIRHQAKLMEAIDELVKGGIRTRGEYQLTDALMIMLNNGEAFRAEKIDGWYDCGKKETLISTSGILLGSENTIVGESVNSILIPPVYIGKNARVKNAILGPNVTVSEGSKVENIIAEHCIFNNDTVIKHINIRNSIIGVESRVNGKAQEINTGDHSELLF